MSPVPFSRRERLMSAVGPAGSGSKPGSVCSHMPEKSGTDLLPLLSAADDCPKTGVTNAAASVSSKGKFRHCISIRLLHLFHDIRPEALSKLHPPSRRLEGDNFCF